VNSYLFIISFEMANGKNIIRSVDLITKSGPVLYTNLLGFPPVILFARIGGEFERNGANLWAREGAHFPAGSIPQAPMWKLFQKPMQDDVVPHDGTWNTDDLSIGESSTHDKEAKMILGVQKSEEMKKRWALS
jgi:hypothetical protein